MLTILYGENDYSIAHKKQQIIDGYMKETGSDIGLEKFDDSIEPQRLWQSINAQPFLVSYKLIVLSNPSQSSELSDFLLTKLDQLPESTHLVIVEGKLDKRTQYYKTVIKNPNTQESKLLTEAELNKWLVGIANAADLKLTNTQTKMVIRRAGTSQWRLYNELQKLMPLGTILDQDIIDLVDQDPTDTVFDMLDAVAAGNRQQAYHLYESLRRQRAEPQYILSMIAWQLQNIFLAATAGDRSNQQIAKDAGMNPYVVGKTKTVASNLSISSLRRAVVAVSDCDESTKTGRAEADEAVRLLVLKLAKIFN